MFGADILFAIIFATVICKAVWDDAYCLVTGKTSARQQRIQKRIEAGKPSLTDIILDGLNTAVNGEKKPKTGEPSMWDTFFTFWKEWWNDAWAEAARQRREKHRKRVEARINEERGGGGSTTTSPPPSTADATPTAPTPPSTPVEPDPPSGPNPDQSSPPPSGGPAEDDDEDPGPRGRAGDWVPPPRAEPPRRTVQATAVVIRPEPAPPRTLPPTDRPALPASGQATTPSEQNGSTPMAPTTLVSASNAVTRMANDDTDPEATILLGHDLEKLAVYMSDVFDARAEDLARVGVGGVTQEILCQIQDDFDNLITLAKKLAVRGNRHADLADHAEEVGDVDAGTYLNRGRKVPRQLRKRAALTGR